MAKEKTLFCPLLVSAVRELIPPERYRYTDLQGGSSVMHIVLVGKYSGYYCYLKKKKNKNFLGTLVSSFSGSFEEFCHFFSH